VPAGRSLCCPACRCRRLAAGLAGAPAHMGSRSPAQVPWLCASARCAVRRRNRGLRSREQEMRRHRGELPSLGGWARTRGAPGTWASPSPVHRCMPPASNLGLGAAAIRESQKGCDAGSNGLARSGLCLLIAELGQWARCERVGRWRGRWATTIFGLEREFGRSVMCSFYFFTIYTGYIYCGSQEGYFPVFRINASEKWRH
jgi:hypothetical protein